MRIYHGIATRPPAAKFDTVRDVKREASSQFTVPIDTFMKEKGSFLIRLA